MTAQEAKRYLYSLKDKRRAIRRLEVQIDEVMQAKSGLRGISYDGIKVQTSVTSDPMVSALAKIDDLISELSHQKALYYDLLASAIRQINQVEDEVEKHILCRHFVDGWKMDDIADDIGYDLRWTYKIYCRAIANFAKLKG